MSGEHKIVGGARRFTVVKEKLSNAALVFETGQIIPDKFNTSSFVDVFDMIEVSALQSEREKLAICVEALEKISYWGVDPTSTAIAAVSEKALDQIKGLKK